MHFRKVLTLTPKNVFLYKTYGDQEIKVFVYGFLSFCLRHFKGVPILFTRLFKGYPILSLRQFLSQGDSERFLKRQKGIVRNPKDPMGVPKESVKVP